MYCLDIEEKTPFAHQPDTIAWVQDHQDWFEQMYLWAISRLADEGYHQYEVSNFSRSSYQSKSNTLVWSGNAYLGLGTGAHSYVNHCRWGNTPSVRTYMNRIQSDLWPTAFEEKLSKTTQANECLMLGLRQPFGFSITCWQNQFGLDWTIENKRLVNTLCEEGYAIWKDPVLSLTHRGLLMADAITSQLMLRENLEV